MATTCALRLLISRAMVPAVSASCKPGLFCKFTHPYPNFPILVCWGTPSFPPVLRKCSPLAAPAAIKIRAFQAKSNSRAERRVHDRLVRVRHRAILQQSEVRFGNMKGTIARGFGLLLILGGSTAYAAEPLVGTWLMTGQKSSAGKSAAIPLTLKVTESGGNLQFSYSMQGGKLITMVFAAHLDGVEVDVKDGTGQKIGSVVVRKVGAGSYDVALKSPEKAPSPGKMTVSKDGKTLTCESTLQMPHETKMTTITQEFTRQ
jgi:hypothetical protein